MKKITAIIIFFVLAVIVIIIRLQEIERLKKHQESISARNYPSVTPIKKKLNAEKLLFVPYWSFDNEKIGSSGFDKLIYFGISVDKNGINKNDIGYLKVGEFSKLADEKKRFLTLRMLDSDINFSVLKNKSLQQKVINESLDIARNNSFNGIVLDFEISALPFDSVVKQVDDFVGLFNKGAKNKNLKFYVLLYGDTFYRVRPYDVENIAKNSDGILLMAYDFHKARGDPGPNFPLDGKEKYGYDFKTMVNDFEKVVSIDKLSVIFGLFGYNWPIDEKMKSKGNADILSLNDIKKQFLNNCIYKNCVVRRDKESSENNITYMDEENILHTVWFEDNLSISEKQKYLLEKGIRSIGFWAYSYF